MLFFSTEIMVPLMGKLVHPTVSCGGFRAYFGCRAIATSAMEQVEEDSSDCNGSVLISRKQSRTSDDEMNKKAIVDIKEKLQ
uniref:Uncharacterized protein n=1 Tax=Cannabis sativa TaxID=3483 RepID=A0A803Q5A2_CANSA